MRDSEQFVDAIRQGDLAAVERMLDEDPALSELQSNGVPVLMLAAYHGHPTIAGVIASRTPHMTLFEAATVGDGEYIESLLSQDSSVVNDYSSDGFTALGFACFFGHLGAAQALLAHGADPSLASRNALGVMPLHSALAGNHREIVELLVEKGAPVNAASAEGWTPLHYTAQAGDADLTEFLLSRGARPAAGPEGKTPAQMALESGHADLAARLA
jgi:uncharacterized protein